MLKEDDCNLMKIYGDDEAQTVLRVASSKHTDVDEKWSQSVKLIQGLQTICLNCFVLQVHPANLERFGKINLVVLST